MLESGDQVDFEAMERLSDQLKTIVYVVVLLRIARFPEFNSVLQ